MNLGKNNLLNQQKEAIERLEKLKVGALFMAPGTGKTLTAYILATSVADVEYILWITPFQTKNNLKKEIIKYGNDSRIDIVGIESIGCSDNIFLEYYNKVEKYNSFIIIDESIKIKNSNTKRTDRALKLSKLAKYKLILNGTPITKNLLDLWSQFEFLSPKILNMSLSQFKNTFCEWHKITKWTKNGKETIEKIKKDHNLEYLYSIIGPYIYECSLKLSIRKNFKDIKYLVEYYEEYDYCKILDKYLNEETLEFMNNKIFMQMTQELQMSYCCSPMKFEILEKIIKKHNKDKIIIFCKYIKSRKKVSELFPEVMVLSYGMHSFGLNLQDKNIIIFFDKTFDYSQRIQSEFRTYRTGQEKDCLYYDLTSDAPLDKMINKNIRKKINLSEKFKELSICKIKEKLWFKK